jgi:hypothetical protein
LKRALVWLALLGLVGCAKFPENGTGTSTRIFVTVTVNGQLQPNLVYIVAMNFTSENPPTTTGPIPVVAPPWGNGFVAGNATHFVRWDPNAFAPVGYQISKFQDVALNNWIPIGFPVITEPVPTNGKTLRFAVDLSQLGYTSIEQANLKFCQLNVLTMDRTPTGTDPGNKVWDGFGDSTTIGGISEWINVPLTFSQTYNNVQGVNNRGLEGANDLVGPYNPDLDIVSWQVEVQRP